MKTFALVDCNNFFVSCERVFNPALKNKPVVVLSNNDGCVISRSNEAKDLGIKMGEPVFKCKHIIEAHSVKVFSTNFALYGDMSHKVMETLEIHSPEIEVYSIDEAFLDLSNVLNPLEYAREIREIVRKWTGIPVSIGLGTTKTLAKAASEITKKNPEFKGVLEIKDNSLLELLDIQKVWGVGRAYSKVLKGHGIITAQDLRKAPLKWVQSKMGVNGLRMIKELNGTSCIDIDNQPEPKKGITCSRSFGEPVKTHEALKEAVAAFASRASEKLREQNSVASTINVYITTSPFGKEVHYSNSSTIELPYPSALTSDFIQAAHKGLKRIFKEGHLYKKAGVFLSGIITDSNLQQNLFKPAFYDTKKKTLMKVLDSISTRWGSHALRYGATGIEKSWRMRQSKRSKRFTTSWSDILKIKI